MIALYRDLASEFAAALPLGGLTVFLGAPFLVRLARRMAP